MTSRYFEIILYLDNSTHMDLFNNLDNIYNYLHNFEFAHIVHSNDINDDGTQKKIHIHLLLMFKNYVSLQYVFDNFPIDNINLIEVRKKKYDAIRYLVHADNKNKYQYDVNDIITTLDDLSRYFRNVSQETQEVEDLITFVLSPTCTRISDLINYSIKNNLWSTLRRNYSILKDLYIDKFNI